MKIRFGSWTRSRPVALGTALAIAIGATALTSSGVAAAIPAPASTASGSDWTVTPAAGGYEVDLTLDTPLPIRDDMPDLVADGVDLGPAASSTDGLTLAVFTTDPSVATAKSISWEWSTGGDDTSTGTTTLATTSAKPNSSTTAVGGAGTVADPSTLATGAFTTMDYNFGAQSIALANLGGVRGELEGRIYLPSTKGAHPLVVFLHGRHGTCSTVATTTATGATRASSSSAWPCVNTSTATTTTVATPILSYAGYDGAGESLAAAGYTVVSISANSINANDGSLGQDAGAAARGQLILDSLTMLKAANTGATVSYHDAQFNTDVSLDQALVAGQATDTLASASPMTAADLVGTMDFDNIGLMGHSRGGEGAVTAGTLNEGLATPWHIKSIFALAPIDFTRATLPDVVQTTLLPYCDGDVSDQQGQHFYADSRNAFSDNVLRSDIWVMGTDHDFYNSSWTPPYPGASDDWSASADAVCGTSTAALASGTNIRLTAPQQFDVGTAYLAAFFELTLGGQTQFQSMFDGSGTEPSSVASFADVRTVAQAPAGSRDDITDFASTSPYVTTSTTATAAVCASRFARTIPVALPSCTNAAVNLATGAQPYWTPASYAPNVPLNQMTHLTWTALTGSLSVLIPQSKADVSAYSEMTVNLSPDDSVTNGTDMTVTVTDTAGKSWSSLLSTLNPWTVNRMPGSTSTLLHKIVLQQIHVPTATLATAGVNVSSLAKVVFTAASGIDNKAVTPNTTTGGEYFQDLTFDTPGLGTTSVQTRPTVNVASTKVEEGNGPHSGEVAVYLSQPSTTTATAYLSVVGSATGKAGIGMEKVTFAPGETCKVVDDVLITGDTVAAAAATAAYKIAVSDSTNSVLGINDFGTITVREDDGATTPAAAYGVQGDACAEFAALSAPGTLSTDTATPAPGATVAVTGSGYRSGESVSFSIAGVTTPLGAAIAGTDGTVSFSATIPTEQPYGDVALTATGAGSGFVSTDVLNVRAVTGTSLALSPAAPSIKQPVTLTATVTGEATEGGVVTFLDGASVLGTATVAAGVATLEVPAGFLAGDHALSAAFGDSGTAAASSSAPVSISLVKGASTIALAMSASTYTLGQVVAGTVTVAGATEGTATVVAGPTVLSVPIGATGVGSFTIPGTVPVGSYSISASYDGTDLVAPSATATAVVSVVPVAPVAKVATTATLKLSATKVKHGHTETAKVTIHGSIAGTHPTGKIEVIITTHGVVKTKTVTLTAKDKGVISLKITPSTKKGSATVKAKYVGDARFLPSTSSSKKVTII